jgi:hypothetical protein
MEDYIRTPTLPDKCPKCEGPQDEDYQCMNGCARAQAEWTTSNW